MKSRQEGSSHKLKAPFRGQGETAFHEIPFLRLGYPRTNEGLLGRDDIECALSYLLFEFTGDVDK